MKSSSHKAMMYLFTVINSLNYLKLYEMLMGYIDRKDYSKEEFEKRCTKEEMAANFGGILPGKSVLSTFSRAAIYEGMDTNNQFLAFLKNLEANFDKEWDTTVKNMKEVTAAVYNKENTMITITCNDKYLDKFTSSIKDFTKNLGNKAFTEQNYIFKVADRNTAYINNEKIVYVAKGDNFKNLGYSYNGTMMVAELADNMYLTKYSANDIKKRRTEVLNTKLEDINRFGQILEEVLKKNNYCVAGNKEKINENKEILDKIVDLTKEYLKSKVSNLKKVYILGSEGAVDSKMLEEHMK